jgi:hypothetical protein
MKRDGHYENYRHECRDARLLRDAHDPERPAINARDLGQVFKVTAELLDQMVKQYRLEGYFYGRHCWIFVDAARSLADRMGITEEIEPSRSWPSGARAPRPGSRRSTQRAGGGAGTDQCGAEYGLARCSLPPRHEGEHRAGRGVFVVPGPPFAWANDRATQS